MSNQKFLTSNTNNTHEQRRTKGIMRGSMQDNTLVNNSEQYNSLFKSNIQT